MKLKHLLISLMASLCLSLLLSSCFGGEEPGGSGKRKKSTEQMLVGQSFIGKEITSDGDGGRITILSRVKFISSEKLVFDVNYKHEFDPSFNLSDNLLKERAVYSYFIAGGKINLGEMLSFEADEPDIVFQVSDPLIWLTLEEGGFLTATLKNVGNAKAFKMILQ